MNTHVKQFSELLTGLAAARIPTRAEFDNAASFADRLKIRNLWRAAWDDQTHPENDAAKWRCIYASLNQDIADYDHTSGRTHPQRDYDPQPKGYGE